VFLLRDPYRLFFPLGLVFGIAGVAIWPLYSSGLTATYSGRAHALVQTYGFLYAFIAGFLLTAVPRFTGTQVPSKAAQCVLAAILTLSVVTSELRSFAVGTTAFVAVHAMLLAMIATRFARRTQKPPPTFSLIGLALIAGAAGAVINAGVAWELVPASLDVLGRRMLTEGMVMLLVLGVGGFLGPRLLGFAALPKPGAPIAAAGDPRMSSIAGLVVLVALVAEYAFDLGWTAYLRAAAISPFLIGTLRLWRRPVIRTTLSWTIWIACWLIALGVWAIAAFPKYRPDFLHVVFVGGFSLLILAIGTRVTLSHGGHDLSAEKRSWPLRIGLTLVLVAALARIGAPFAPNTYFSHLMWASLCWIAGMICWGGYIVSRIRSHG
jgi:uncharacterized protein involved in response to NO